MLENVIKLIIKILDINPAQYEKLRNHWVFNIKLRDEGFEMIPDIILDSLKGVSESEKNKKARIKREFKNLEILRIRPLQEAKKAKLFLNNKRTSDDIFHRYYKLYLGQFEWENDQIKFNKKSYAISKENENLKAGY